MPGEASTSSVRRKMVCIIIPIILTILVILVIMALLWLNMYCKIRNRIWEDCEEANSTQYYYT